MACPPPSFVQQNSNTACVCCTPSIDHISTPFSGNNTLGDTIIVLLGYEIANRGPTFDCVDLFSIQDTNNNVYTRVQVQFDNDGFGGSATNGGVIVWMAKNVAGGANTVTINFSRAVPPPFTLPAEPDVVMMVREYTPGAVNFAFDNSNGTSYFNIGNGQHTNTGNLSPSQSVALVLSFAFSSFVEFGDVITFTPSAGWGNLASNVVDQSFTLAVADMIVQSSGTFANNWTFGSQQSETAFVTTGIGSFDGVCSGGGGSSGGIFRFQGSLQNMVGYKIEGVEIYVCNQPLTQQMQPTGPPPNFNVPPAPLAMLFTDTTGKTQLANPVITDANGNFFFYATVGTYTFVIYDKYNRIPNAAFQNPTRTPVIVLPDMEVLIPAIAASPITIVGDGVVLAPIVPATGTPNISLTPAVASAPANDVIAGPTSGAPGPLVQRKLVGADLPAATGAARGAVQLTGDLAPPSTAPLVVGSHLAANLPNNQGGRGNMAALGSINSPPTFDCAGNSSFTMTLSGNIASSSSTGAVKGQTYVFKITQDATGGRTFAWPTGFHGMSGVALDANLTSVQEFLFDGTTMRAIGPGEVMA